MMINRRANAQGQIQGQSAQGRYNGERARVDTMAVRGTADGEVGLKTADLVRDSKRRFGLVVRLIANECYRIHFAIYPSYRQPSGLHSLQSRPLIYRLHRTTPQDPTATDIVEKQLFWKASG